MSKDADAFRTISEVAEELDVPQHVLRFWETRFPQVKPLKRAGNRRYYRRDEVDLLVAIRRLLYGEGYTIKGVQRILKTQGARSVAALAGIGPETPNGAGEDGAAAGSGHGLVDTEATPVSPPDTLCRHLADIARELETCAAILGAVRGVDPAK